MDAVTLVEELLDADLLEDDAWEREGVAWGQVEAHKDHDEADGLLWRSQISGQEVRLHVDDALRISRPYLTKLDEADCRTEGTIVLRSLCLLIDYGESLAHNYTLKTSSPSTFVTQVFLAFVTEFFELCPLSEVCLVIMVDNVAVTMATLSSNCAQIKETLAAYASQQLPSGNVSLQAGLEKASIMLEAGKPYSRKEILCMWSSTATHDAGVIEDTIRVLASKNILVNIVSITPHLHVLQRVTRACHGAYWVLKDPSSFKERISLYARAQPINEVDRSVLANSLLVGFPEIETSKCAALCSCHNQLKFHGYTCPRCLSRNCEVPTTCAACGLLLIKALDVARCAKSSYEVPAYLPTPKLDPPKNCYMCDRFVVTGGGVCLRCYNLFCIDCDVIIHEALLPCPGCQFIRLLARQGLHLSCNSPPPPLPPEHPQYKFYKKLCTQLNQAMS